MATSNVKLNEILRQDVQEQLDGSESVLIKTIMDLTPRALMGMDRLTIPRASGLTLTTVVPGTRAADGTYSIDGDELLLNQSKQVNEYISWINGKDSAVDIEEAFFAGAPRVFAEGVEGIIATELATVSPNDFNSGIAASFTVDNIATAKKHLDQARVPKRDRFLAVNAVGMEILAATQEFQDGQKSLSDEALKDGVVSMVKGFKVVQSEDVADDKVHCYHRDAVAFALHGEMEAISKENEEYAQKFLALRGKYGAKALDSGNRKLTITMAV